MAAMVAVTVVLLSTQVPNGECFSNASSRIADNLVDAEEFLMESETARRVLQQQTSDLYKGVLDKNKGYCIDGDKRYSCDPRLNKNGKQRDCGYDNKCKRP